LLDPKQIDHVATLARLGLSDEEKQTMLTELAQILEHFQLLEALDTRDVEPTAQVIPLVNTM